MYSNEIVQDYSLLLSQAVPVKPSMQTQFPLIHIPLPLHGVLRWAVSVAAAVSLKATPLGHTRIEQSPPVNPLLHVQIPSELQVPFLEHLFGHPEQGRTNNSRTVTQDLMDV
jgi:hypothetical protein